MEGAVSAVLTRLAQCGVSVRWRDGKAVFRAEAAPPADIVAFIEARKADVSAFLHPDAVQRRLDAKADVLRAPCPPDVTDAHWAIALRGLHAFLANGHGDEAERLGWPKDELYAVPPVWSRVSDCGAALLIGDNEVAEVTASRIGIKTSSGAPQGLYRKPAIDYGVAYRARIKEAGEDACKAEVQLRALEAVVNLYRANNPSATIDDAAAAVRAAIKE